MLFKTVIETLFVTVLFYTVLRPLRSKKFLRIAWSIIAVVLLAKALEAMGFLAVSWIIERAGVLLPILFVVLFQTEIRRSLEGISVKGWFKGSVLSNTEDAGILVSTIMGSLREFKRSRLGALLIFEGTDRLENILGELGGVELDSKVTVGLLKSIFQIQSPLHDGAVVIRSGRVRKAQVIIPLPPGGAEYKGYGTRHRAAQSATGGTGALSIVVSEENQSVSISEGGQLKQNLSFERVEEELIKFIKNTI